MSERLSKHLSSFAARSPLHRDAASAVDKLADAAAALRTRIADDEAAGAEASGTAPNGGGDIQKGLDAEADRLFSEAARRAPIAWFGSEEEDEAAPLDPAGTLALAIDPLDGSSNIGTDVSVGTIFSILPVRDGHDKADTVFRQPGSRQLAAGFFIYGPQLLLVLSVGEGTHVFLAKPGSAEFLHQGSLSVPPQAPEFAINMSNRRHWDEGVRTYVDDCMAGTEGPRGRDFNMRWIASMVADAYRIFTRGGVYLYPGDNRKGYADGRIRLLYEANPVAFCAVNAGGAASDGARPLLDVVPDHLHQRIPVVIGSREEVEAVNRYFGGNPSAAPRAGDAP